MSLHVNLLYVNFVVSTVLPMLTALVTKREASKQLKALTLVVFSVIGGVGNALIQGGGNFSFDQAGIWAIITFAVAAIMHSGLLKPLGITGSAGLIAMKFPAGLGQDRQSRIAASLRPARRKPPTSLA